jgi:hypothetical protein
METTITASLDPTLISSIRGFGCHKYWLISAWLKFESCFVDFKGLATLGLARLGCTTWGALVLMIVCRPTFDTNVISLMSSIRGVG